MAKVVWARPGAVPTADSECQAEAEATSTADEVAAEAASAAYKVMAEWSQKRVSVEAGRNRETKTKEL